MRSSRSSSRTGPSATAVERRMRRRNATDWAASSRSRSSSPVSPPAAWTTRPPRSSEPAMTGATQVSSAARTGRRRAWASSEAFSTASSTASSSRPGTSPMAASDRPPGSRIRTLASRASAAALATLHRSPPDRTRFMMRPWASLTCRIRVSRVRTRELSRSSSETSARVRSRRPAFSTARAARSASAARSPISSAVWWRTRRSAPNRVPMTVSPLRSGAATIAWRPSVRRAASAASSKAGAWTPASREPEGAKRSSAR